MLLDQHDEPFALFQHYFAQAKEKERFDVTAVALGTADARGRPAVRMVLLKGVDHGGFVFFTNYHSRKGQHLTENPEAALCFYWPILALQVRAEGPVTQLTAGESDSYFATRPRGSQLAAWASDQSAALPSRTELLQRYQTLEQRLEGQPVTRPPHWGGYRLLPRRVEFWENEAFRMHDRLLYEQDGAGWRKSRLFP